MMTSDTSKSPKASSRDIEASKLRGNRPILPPPKGMSYPKAVSEPDIHQTTSSAQQDSSSRSLDRVENAASDTNAVTNHDLAAPDPNSSTAPPLLAVSSHAFDGNNIPDAGEDLAAILVDCAVPPAEIKAFMSHPEARLPDHLYNRLDRSTKNRLYRQRRTKFPDGRLPTSEDVSFQPSEYPIVGNKSVQNHDSAAITGFKDPELMKDMAHSASELPDHLRARLDEELQQYRASQTSGAAESRKFTKNEVKKINQEYQIALADPLAYGLADNAGEVHKESSVQEPAKSKSKNRASARFQVQDANTQDQGPQTKPASGGTRQNDGAQTIPTSTSSIPSNNSPSLNLQVPLKQNTPNPDYKRMKGLCDRGGKLGKNKLLGNSCEECQRKGKYNDFWPGCELIKEFSNFNERTMYRTK